MQRRNIRYSLALLFLLSSNAWALGLGEIRIDSALNAPLRAEIELLAASPEELDNLQVALASQETFERYGLDRPFYLQSLRFEIVRSGSQEGNYVSITSSNPITEPFLTFLVEATWSSGRLLREYTVLLDPPTFAPPAAADTRPAVTAPERSTPTDSARIDRPAPRTEPMASEPEPAPAQPIPAPPVRTEPAAEPPSYDEPAAAEPTRASAPPVEFDGSEIQVARGQTLWGIAAEVRPDFNLTMNQTMLAIYEANPEAFGGNINFLKAGATLRIPGSDAIYNIDRAYALQEAQRQHADWDGTPVPAPAPTTAYEEPAETDTRPSLQLVPPDEDVVGVGTGDADTAIDADPDAAREQEILDRIAELEAADVPQQRSLIEIRDNELSTLREELARIRGEVYEPPVEDDLATDDLMVDDTDAGELSADLDEEAADDAATDEAVADEAETEPAPQIISRPAQQEPGIVDQILGVLSNTWVWIIGGVVLVAAGIAAWFVRRSRDSDDDLESWTDAQAAAPDLDDTMMSATESLSAPAHDESIVVVEQGSGMRPLDDDTLDAPAVDTPDIGDTAQLTAATGQFTGQFDSLEDTFSSDTAVNLDQSDPIAEADFHMAYGLYDQAADLVNGALDVEPERLDLLTKLCEIYFVWGNRDAFIDASQRVKLAVDGDENADWDKIVIMGQQIAADHELFAGAGVAGATRAVDLSFEAEADGASELDMDFGAAAEEGDDVIDLGLAVEDDSQVIDLGASSETPLEASSVDFVMEDEEETGEMAAAPEEDFGDLEVSPTFEASGDTATSEMASPESPTIEDQFDAIDSTSELPSIPDPVDAAIARTGQSPGETAEINLDELGLDLDELEDTGSEAIDDLAETELATLDEGDEIELGNLDDPLSITSSQKSLGDTSLQEALGEPVEDTARNPEIDPDQTGFQKQLSADDTSMVEALDIDDALSATGRMRLAADETGQNPLMHQVPEDETEFDDSLLEATGRTQILPEDFAVDMGVEETAVITDDAETLLATLDDDDDTEAASLSDEEATVLAPAMGDDSDFDFAKTEALPKDMYTGNMDLDETGEMPAVASTDVDLDLDDLTAALKVSEMGDTVDMPRDDATVEHVRPDISMDDDSVEVPTMSLSQDEMSEDLMEARTMTEVGTKLDLARAYVDMGDPGGARSILEEVLDEGDEGQRQQAQQLLESLAS
jgi:pilus assembly protein FimV